MTNKKKKTNRASCVAREVVAVVHFPPPVHTVNTSVLINLIYLLLTQLVCMGKDVIKIHILVFRG